MSQIPGQRGREETKEAVQLLGSPPLTGGDKGEGE
jgi:hypothetical protein